MSLLRLLSLLIFAAAVAIILLAIVLIATPGGTRWLLVQIEQRTGGALEVSGVAGTFAGSIDVERLRIRLDTVVIDADRLHLRPDWLRAFERRSLVFDRVSADRLHIDVVERPPPSTPEPLRIVLPRLPVAVAIRHLDVAALESDRLPEEFWGRVSARVDLRPGNWTLDRLDIDTARVAVVGNLRASLAGAVPLGGALEWRLRAPEASGSAAVSGDLTTLRAAVSVVTPTVLDGAATLDLNGSLAPLLTVTIAPQDVRWAALNAVALEASGQIEWGAAPRVEARASASGGDWSERRFSDAKLAVAGRFDAFAGTASVMLHVEGQPDASLTARFQGSPDALSLEEAVVTTSQGRAEASGDVVFSPLAVRLAGALDAFDPSYWLPSFTGSLAGTYRIDYEDGRLAVVVPSIEGVLNDAPFALVVEVHGGDGVWTVDGLTLRSGMSVLEVAGRFAPERMEARGRFDLVGIERWYPDVAGALAGQYEFAGTLERPTLRAKLTTPSLAWREHTIEGAQFDVDVVDAQARSLTLSADRVAAPWASLGAVGIASKGSLDAFTLSVVATAAGERSALEFSGAWRHDRLAAKVTEGGVLAAAGESVRLDRPLALDWTRDGRFDVSSHCWVRTGGAGRLCIEAAHNERFAGRLEDLPVALLSGLVAGLPELTGTLGGQFDFERGARGWAGAGQLGTEGLALRGLAAGGDDPDGDVSLGDLTFAATVAADRARIQGEMTGLEHGRLVLDLTLDGLTAQGALDGLLTMEASDIAPVQRFSRRIGEIGGRAAGSMRIGGSPLAPLLSGSLSLREGVVVWVDPRVDLSELSIDLVAASSERVEIRGEGRSASGRVTLEGALVDPLLSTQALALNVHSDGLDISVPEGELLAEVDGLLRWVPGAVDVSGNVAVPRARIRVAERAAGAVRRSDDAIVVDREIIAPSVTRLAVDMRVTLGRDVRFKGLGLDTRLTGRLRLRETRDGAVRVNGTVNVAEGQFSVLGQTLTIERGRLVFSGPVDDPFVDARATRTIQEGGETIVAGVSISGRAQALESTLFSTPAMPDSQILSYLMIGRPLGSATAEEGTDMTGAAVALGLKGAAPVIDEIRGAFGLEELTASGASSEELALVAGKRLSRKVFVRYTYQTFTGMSALLIQLALTNRLRLEATAAEAPAMDLIYRVGRGE